MTENDKKELEKNTAMRSRAEQYLASCDEYTHPEERRRLIENWEVQYSRAQGIFSDFLKRAGNPSGKKLLEIGFGSGSQLIVFAKAGAKVSGVEINHTLYEIAKEQFGKHEINGDLRVYEGTKLPFPDKTFDYIFSVSVLEHVSDAESVIKEAARVLAPGGKFYLSFPNRFTLVEHHTGIWGIGYLPRTWASFVVRRFYKRDSIEELNLHFLSYFNLLRLLKDTDLSIKYEIESVSKIKRSIKYILSKIGFHHGAFLRTVMVILEKPL